MSDILLVHGSCHGAWCWRDLIPALQELGHSPRAIDLPSHGDDTTPVNAVTLDSYADAVLAASTPDTVVVGHSRHLELQSGYGSLHLFSPRRYGDNVVDFFRKDAQGI